MIDVFAGNSQVHTVDRVPAGMEAVSPHVLLGTHVVLLVSDTCMLLYELLLAHKLLSWLSQKPFQ